MKDKIPANLNINGYVENFRSWEKPLSKPIPVPKPESKKKKGRFEKEAKDEV